MLPQNLILLYNVTSQIKQAKEEERNKEYNELLDKKMAVELGRVSVSGRESIKPYSVS